MRQISDRSHSLKILSLEKRDKILPNNNAHPFHSCELYLFMRENYLKIQIINIKQMQ